MNKFFFKKFFPQLQGWIITTILLEIISWPYLPEMVNALLRSLQNSPIVSSFVVLLMSFSLYVLFVMFRFARDFYRTYCEDVRNIDNTLRDCYLRFVIADRKIISGRVQDLHSASGADLLWETHGLALDNICKLDNCELSKTNNCKSPWPFKEYFDIISTRRRNRMIRISLSFPNWRTNTCYAVETHLKDIICNQHKFKADCDYRENQIKKLKKLRPFKLDIKRIVIINEKDLTLLKNNHIHNLIQYFQWHVTNKWDAILCVSHDNTDPLTLSSIIQLGNNAYDDFSDFVIIKKWNDNNLVVFAQNSAEQARIVYETTSDSYYYNWFNNAWKQANADDNTTDPNEYYHVDQNFISSKLNLNEK
ncbi:MAG: hypothetical protein AUK63_2054 [bacterium P3]|nr:MAG: hypothetical protein AUK63_2054 [bacterium P3]KWW33250.1 MAG: hypothetical protein F083_2546 [bacterium F083]